LLVHASAGAWLTVRTGHRVLAAATALAFALTTLLGMLHEAAITHVVCVQHGELIHDDAIASAPSAPSGTTAATLSDLAAPARPSHEHCALASAMRASRTLPGAPSIVPARVTAREVPLALLRVVAARDRELYRTAPKTSPPA
jgi:hypothetical protein